MKLAPTQYRNLANYFAAQCLTDDVMAYHFTQLPFGETRFLIAGSFHTDLKDGTVHRILVRDSSESPVVMRFMDASDFSTQELETSVNQLLHDPQYGDVADYVLFVNEPHANE